jgi:hypothetical protein
VRGLRLEIVDGIKKEGRKQEEEGMVEAEGRKHVGAIERWH